MAHVSMHPCLLFIQDEVELERYIAAVNMPGNLLALSNRCSYVREARECQG
jgi:hypothetical protein